MFGLLRKIARAIIRFFLGVFQKAICCTRRIKRTSSESILLTEIGVDPAMPPDPMLWGPWDEVPIIVTDPGPRPSESIHLKIEEFRERKRILQHEDAKEAIDYFQDMAPKFTKQPIVMAQGLEADERGPENSSLFEINPNFLPPELGAWDDSGKWEDDRVNEWGTFEILNEKRKVEKVKRTSDQQKKRQSKDQQPRRNIGSPKLA